MAFNGRFLLNLINFAQKQGADRNLLVANSGNTLEELCKEDCTVSSETYNRVLELAIEQTQDEFFGLHMGESLNLMAAGLIAQITHTSSTVKEAIEYCCEFAKLGCSSLPMSLLMIGNEYKLSMIPEKLWSQQSPMAVKQTVDGTLVFTIREFQSLTVNLQFPLKIELPFTAPKNKREYERLLSCPIYFNRDQIAIYFSKDQMEAPVISKDYKLLRILVNHARIKLDSIKQDLGFAEIVRESIVNLVKPQFPTIEEVAQQLNVSVRSLQRKLTNEGITFKEIVESIRDEFALSYLRSEDLSINEIAYLLSFTDASSFIRSFKRIHGLTPNEFKRNMLAN